MTQNIAGKVVVITGASSGLGGRGVHSRADGRAAQPAGSDAG
jgi:NADP-dependent 3-hydroxy acid dehydrogenase YdfG